MKKSYLLRTSIVLLLLVIGNCWVYPAIKEIGMQHRREELAKKLIVSIDDYPYPKIFPLGYFYTILQEGMPINKVHEVILGYDRVYHCGKSVEIYYYYDTDDTKALRYQVLYDANQNFWSSSGEDEDSRTISVRGCELGKLSIR